MLKTELLAIFKVGGIELLKIHQDSIVELQEHKKQSQYHHVYVASGLTLPLLIYS